jgi:serine protease Do
MQSRKQFTRVWNGANPRFGAEKNALPAAGSITGGGSDKGEVPKRCTFDTDAQHFTRQITVTNNDAVRRRTRVIRLLNCMLSLSIAFAVASPAVTVGQTVTRNSSARLNPLRISSEAIEALVSRVMPSVVQIIVTGYRPQERGNEFRTDIAVRRGRTIGSGVIIDSAGYILTNAHVVDGAERTQVVLARDAIATGLVGISAADERVLEARVIGKSDELDLALLAVNVRGLPSLPLADYSAVRQGELVFAFGSPDALRNSVSMGVVSAVAQQAESDSPIVWIQTDAAVNPGNSGGPLVNVEGELIGLNTFIRSMSGGSEGLGFAVPSAVIALAYPQLRDYGHLHRALLGVAAQPITPQLRSGLSLSTDVGVIAADITPGGPAAKAGVRMGDVITGIGGQSLDTMSLARFYLFLLTLTEGQQVSVNVLRGSQPLTLTASATLPAHRCERIEPVDLEGNLVERLGFIGAPVDQSVADMLPALRAPSGVLVVMRVDTPHTPELPLTRGDVIHAVNGTWVTTPAELREALSRFGPGDAVVLQVERNGQLTYVVYETE